MKTRVFPLLIPAVAMSILLPSSAPAEYPACEKKPVTDEYHGVKIVDDYRWLEESGSPAVKAWTDAQKKFTRAFLDALPDRAGIEARLTALYAKDTPSHSGLVSRPGRIFALKFQPPKQQRLLVTLKSAYDLASEKIVLDPNELEPKGQVAMDWFMPSPDGKLIAVCLSEHGSEDGVLHFYRTENGEHLPDRIPRVQYPTGGGSVAWTPDAKAVFFTRYPHKGEKAEADANFFQQIYFHTLGTPESADTYSEGRDFPRIAEIDFDTSRDGRWVIAKVANGDGGEFAHYVRDMQAGADAKWRQVTRFEDGVKDAAISCDGATIFLRSVKDAPRGKILRLPLDGSKALADAEIFVPESDAREGEIGVIEEMVPTKSYLFTTRLIGGPSQIHYYDLDAPNSQGILNDSDYEPSGYSSLVALQDSPDDDRILFRRISYTKPAEWWVHNDWADNAVVFKNTPPVDFSDIRVEREFAVSKDGTKIPINIMCKKSTDLTGSNPTLLYAYGGYGISMRPRFDFDHRLWFDRGGVYVVANIRGGGEFGEAWHLAGNLTRKQNVFDDFAACARHLIKRGYTRPEKLAVEGGSNGGLLMGAFLTQNPGLARAVVSHVGIYDMLRVELDPNGAFNVTEFGTVKDPAQFRALHAYSPFHNVTDGTKYPAVLFLAGETDGRVNPSNSRKMTARLQAATASGSPILVRLSSASGHGMGTALSERIAQEADVFAFLFDQLGMGKK